MNRYLSLVFFICLLLIAFLSAFGNNLTALPLAGLVICWFFEGDWKQKLKMLSGSVWLMLFTSYYILTLITLTYTRSMHGGLLNIGIQLPILLLPLVLSTSENKLMKTAPKYIFGTLLASSLIILIICFSRALYKYSLNHDTSEFFYTKLAGNLHPGFLSMYENFSIILLIYSLCSDSDILNFRILRSPYLRLFLMFFMFFFVFFLTSKTGTITCFLTLCSFVIYYLAKMKGKALKALIVLFFAGMVFLISHSTVKDRFSRASSSISNRGIPVPKTSHNAEESTVLRMEALKAATEIIKAHWLLGIGNGSVENELCRIYEEKGLIYNLGRRVSPHNLYLKVWAENGIFGLLALLAMFLAPLYYSIREKKFLIFSFILIMMINCLTDDIIYLQSGVMFYAFLNSLLIFVYPKLQKPFSKSSI